MRLQALAAALALLAATAAPAAAGTLCTLLVDAATGEIVHESGDCDRRTTPASTFKIALALMGYDAGNLEGPHAPVLPFREGYPDWIAAWRQPTDPAGWMKHSVVWYSQQVAQALGRERFDAYLVRLSYGNADGSGDPGKDNALERSWISSSLAISPREQVAFLARLVRRELPVSRAAMEMTDRIVEQAQASGGWTVRGKTGSAYPRRADGRFDRARGWGWYVGWATRGDRTLVFARLTQDESRQTVSAGLRTRDGLLRDLAGLAR